MKLTENRQSKWKLLVLGFLFLNPYNIFCLFYEMFEIVGMSLLLLKFHFWYHSRGDWEDSDDVTFLQNYRNTLNRRPFSVTKKLSFSQLDRKVAFFKTKYY